MWTDHTLKTKLSTYISSLKDAEKPYNVKWSITERIKSNTKINYSSPFVAKKYHFIEYLNDIRLSNCLKRNDGMD